MIQIIFKPELHQFNNCAEFVEEFKPGKRDLILTNEYIYEPFFSKLGLESPTIFQEKYGTGEPTDVMAEAILRDAAQIDYDRLIAVGGGTILDLAKIIAVADTENVDELYDKMPNFNKVKELVLVPTTCGTGSEVTNIGILARTRLGTKMGLVSPSMYADKAVLIPELLTSLPLYVFATSSIDALVHAVESSLSPKATPFTKLFGYKAIEMIVKGFKTIYEKGVDYRNEIMSDFMLASNYAGLAFGTAGCATVHAMAYPLGGVYHVAHGESNYAMFTGVLNAYMEHNPSGAIAEFNQFIADILECPVESAYEELEKIMNNLVPKKSLKEYGVKEEELEEFAKSVVENQQRLLANSYVPMTEELIYKIYKALY